MAIFPSCCLPRAFPRHGQYTPLIVTQQDSFAPKFLAKYLILRPKVVDYLFLFLAYGLTEYSEDDLQGVQKKRHRLGPDQ